MLALARKPLGVSRAEASMARFQNWGAVEKRADTEGTFRHLWVLSTWHPRPPSVFSVSLCVLLARFHAKVGTASCVEDAWQA